MARTGFVGEEMVDDRQEIFCQRFPPVGAGNRCSFRLAVAAGVVGDEPEAGGGEGGPVDQPRAQSAARLCVSPCALITIGPVPSSP